jgi:VWFA-related protein
VTGKKLSALFWSVLLGVTSWNPVAHAVALPEASAPGIAVDFPATELSAGDLNLTIAKASLLEFTIRRTVPEVRLQFTVVDENGHLQKAISGNDLQIFDNRLAVRRIRDFSRTEDLPLDADILLDVSDSVEKTSLRERQLIQYFVTRIVRPQTDRVALMAFSRDVALWQRSTGDRDALSRALARIPEHGSITYLYDSVYRTCLEQFAPPQAGDPAQRILLLITDGEDTGSLHSLADAISAAQRRDIQIYALSVHSARQLPPGDNVLKQMTEATGGQLYVAATEKDFPALFASMEQQMRTQYFVSFQPVDQTPGFHTVQIGLAGGGKLQVRSRKGYFFDAR